MKGETDAILHLVRALWAVREDSNGHLDAHAVKTWGRMLAEATQAEARDDSDYSPEVDRRVLWAREVLAAAVRREQRCRASAELEATVEFMLGLTRERELCGRDLAAGERVDS